MAEILICWRNVTHPDADTDRRGAWKRGYPVTVVEDGHRWGRRERLPRFIVLAFPGVPVERLERYVEPQLEVGPADPPVYRRRLWRLRAADVPADIRAKAQSTGRLTIKATPAYAGSYDLTWRQVRRYFRNQFTGQDEERDL